MSKEVVVEKFSEAFSNLRKQAGEDRTGLAVEELASQLSLHSATIERIESGERKPYRSADFYQDLLNIPGFGLEGVKRLLKTVDAPKVIDTNPNSPTSVDIVYPGIETATYADTSRLSDSQLRRLKPDAIVTRRQFLSQLTEKSQNPQE